MIRLRHAADEGISLIEVVVAVLVFAIIASGLIAGLTTITRMTADNRARTVANGLAAQEISLARAIGDPFQLASTGPTPQVVGGLTYTVTRSVSWVSQSGADASCNAGTDLFYRRVNVRVTWAGQLATTPAAQDDTIVASQGRISDSANGAIAVSVIGADGAAESGVSVAITPVSGGASLAEQPDPTNGSGCTYASGVTPGTYSVTVSKAGFVDTNQNPSPSTTVLVTAGVNQATSFQYDQAARYTTAYPNTYTSPSVLIPSNLDTTFVNSSSGLYITSSPATSVSLHPFASGYTVVGGVLGTTNGTTTCASVDPSAWAAGASSSGVLLATGQRASGAGVAGSTTQLKTSSVNGIPMGVVQVTVSSNKVIQATQATPQGTGNPGCSSATTSPKTYTFSSKTSGSSTSIALPFGSWTISVGSSSTSLSTVGASNLSATTNVGGGGVNATNNVVTLDPRPRA